MGNPEQPKVVDATAKPDGNAVDYEKRFKDTQGAYTKSQQELKAAQAKLDALEKLTTPKVELDEAAKAELDELKYSDPDSWRNRMNGLEVEAQNKHRNTLDEASKQAMAQAEMGRRTQVLEDFSKNHPNLVINDEVIKYDVPPRITNKLESGEVTFEQYLDDVAQYLTAPKVVGSSNTTTGQPNLGQTGGGDTPTDGAIKKDIVKDYADIVF